jgi:hypothetical protein
MAQYTFEREARTPFSETYAVREAERDVARVDLHFGQSGIVHGTLCVPDAYGEQQIEELIAEIDARLVLAADANREDFVVTVWRGQRVGVYSEELDGDDGDTNGTFPG